MMTKYGAIPEQTAKTAAGNPGTKDLKYEEDLRRRHDQFKRLYGVDPTAETRIVPALGEGKQP